MSEIILFDLASKDPCTSWSPNAWKTRLILNYKSLPYTTHWLEYPDISPTLSSFDIPPNPPGSLFTYCVPAIYLPDNGGSYVMDSKKIAIALEEKYPDRPLHLDDPSLAKIEELLPALLRHTSNMTVPKTARNLLNDKSLPYFLDSREKIFGIPVSEMEKERGGEEAWAAAREAIRPIGAVVKENGGPFVLGEGKVSYADFLIVAWLQFFRRMGEGVFERVVEMEPALGRVYEASRGWMKKDR
ncbi:MAG: hypothetical protein Q9190_000828 [Brigantiaea leucoxantha]